MFSAPILATLSAPILDKSVERPLLATHRLSNRSSRLKCGRRQDCLPHSTVQ